MANIQSIGNSAPGMCNGIAANWAAGIFRHVTRLMHICREVYIYIYIHALVVRFPPQTSKRIPAHSEVMSRPQVIIPTTLESHLCTESGQQGADARRALSMEETSVGNLYSFDAELGQLKYAFKENGVAYNETETSGLLCEATLNLKSSDPASFTLEFEEGAVQRWGITFCGVVRVKHASGEVREVYLPGTRTYDPAGMTGRSIVPICYESKHITSDLGILTYPFK